MHYCIYSQYHKMREKSFLGLSQPLGGGGGGGGGVPMPPTPPLDGTDKIVD